MHHHRLQALLLQLLQSCTITAAAAADMTATHHGRSRQGVGESKAKAKYLFTCLLGHLACSSNSEPASVLGLLLVCACVVVWSHGICLTLALAAEAQAAASKDMLVAPFLSICEL